MKKEKNVAMPLLKVYNFFKQVSRGFVNSG